MEYLSYNWAVLNESITPGWRIYINLSQKIFMQTRTSTYQWSYRLSNSSSGTSSRLSSPGMRHFSPMTSIASCIPIILRALILFYPPLYWPPILGALYGGSLTIISMILRSGPQCERIVCGSCWGCVRLLTTYNDRCVFLILRNMYPPLTFYNVIWSPPVTPCCIWVPTNSRSVSDFCRMLGMSLVWVLVPTGSV